MGFACGIVGLPNVGKSSLFNVLTNANAAASNYPFCTIEPNVGIVPVPDKRLDFIFETIQPAKKVPATIKFVDIAGLVEGASKNEGLGNQFLSHIREVDAIVHVVRLFQNADIVHIGAIDPIRDLEIIETELALKDLESLEKRKIKLEKKVRSQSDREAKDEMEMVQALLKALSDGKMLYSMLPGFTDKQQSLIKTFALLTAKPAMIVANLDEQMQMDSRVKDFAAQRQYPLIPISVQLESEINSLPEDERVEFMKDFGLEQSGLERMIRCGYDLLGLETFFTAGGPTEARAWTIQKQTLAPKAAGVIHSDFERGFIKAEVLSYEDFVQYRDFHQAKTAGKLRIEGKEYIVKDGDIIEFRFNV